MGIIDQLKSNTNIVQKPIHEDELNKFLEEQVWGKPYSGSKMKFTRSTRFYLGGGGRIGIDQTHSGGKMIEVGIKSWVDLGFGTEEEFSNLYQRLSDEGEIKI